MRGSTLHDGAVKAQRNELIQMINKKLTGQARVDAILFVRGVHRRAADLERLAAQLKTREDVDLECHPRARLTDKAILEMRAAAEAGETQQQLAKRYGVTASHVYKILSGRARPVSGQTA